MKRSTKISTIATLAVATFAFASAPVGYNTVTANTPENEGSSSGYFGPETDTAMVEQDSSQDYLGPETDTAMVEQDSSQDYLGPETDTA